MYTSSYSSTSLFIILNSVWQWLTSENSVYAEIEQIHNHLINVLHAYQVQSPSHTSQASVDSNQFKPQPNSTWYRICEFMSHRAPSISGTGGGLTKNYRSILPSSPALNPPQQSNPSYVNSLKASINTNTLFKLTFSENARDLYFVTPHCPQAEKLHQYDKALLPSSIKAIKSEVDKQLNPPLQPPELMNQAPKVDPSSRIIDPSNCPTLPSASYLNDVHNSLVPTITHTQQGFADILERMGHVDRTRTLVAEGSMYVYGDIVIRVGSLSSDAQVTNSIIVEIEHMAVNDVDADPLLFTELFSVVVPHAHTLYFTEANTWLSPCADHDPAEINTQLSISQTHEGLSAGIRVTPALCKGFPVFGVEGMYSLAHTAIQYTHILTCIGSAKQKQ